MAGFTNYLEDKVIGHLFGGTAYTAPTTWYAGLQTAAPSDSAGGTEVSGGAYARQAISWTSTSGGKESFRLRVASGYYGLGNSYALRGV